MIVCGVEVEGQDARLEDQEIVEAQVPMSPTNVAPINIKETRESSTPDPTNAYLLVPHSST